MHSQTPVVFLYILLGSLWSAHGCVSSEFRCRDNGMCVASDGRCDGHFDCHDGSDEKGCPIPGRNHEQGHLPHEGAYL